MDALGITGAILDEYWGYEAPGPGFTLPQGARRFTSPSAEIAFSLFPDRFRYVQRLDAADPRNADIIALLRETPGARAIRVTPGLTDAEVEDFAASHYTGLFRSAVDADLTIFVMIQGNVHLLAPYLEEFPRGRFVIDHCGMPLESSLRRAGSSIQATVDRGSSYEYFDEVLKMAKWPNVALKWAHAQGVFGQTDFPFDGLTGFLRRAVDAFGAERVMWASDGTVLRDTTWADTLYFIKASHDLSEDEKGWVLAKSARRWLAWDLDADQSTSNVGNARTNIPG